jgi:hypothetical protein
LEYFNWFYITILRTKIQMLCTRIKGHTDIFSHFKY